MPAGHLGVALGPIMIAQRPVRLDVVRVELQRRAQPVPALLGVDELQERLADLHPRVDVVRLRPQFGHQLVRRGQRLRDGRHPGRLLGGVLRPPHLPQHLGIAVANPSVERLDRQRLLEPAGRGLGVLAGRLDASRFGERLGPGVVGVVAEQPVHLPQPVLRAGQGGVDDRLGLIQPPQLTQRLGHADECRFGFLQMLGRLGERGVGVVVAEVHVQQLAQFVPGPRVVRPAVDRGPQLRLGPVVLAVVLADAGLIDVRPRGVGEVLLPDGDHLLGLGQLVCLQHAADPCLAYRLQVVAAGEQFGQVGLQRADIALLRPGQPGLALQSLAGAALAGRLGNQRGNRLDLAPPPGDAGLLQGDPAVTGIPPRSPLQPRLGRGVVEHLRLVLGPADAVVGRIQPPGEQGQQHRSGEEQPPGESTPPVDRFGGPSGLSGLGGLAVQDSRPRLVRLLRRCRSSPHARTIHQSPSPVNPRPHGRGLVLPVRQRRTFGGAGRPLPVGSLGDPESSGI